MDYWEYTVAAVVEDGGAPFLAPLVAYPERELAVRALAVAKRSHAQGGYAPEVQSVVMVETWREAGSTPHWEAQA